MDMSTIRLMGIAYRMFSRHKLAQ